MRIWLVAVAVLFAAPAAAQTHLAAGGDLQAALTNAACGDTITLEAGATWTGTYTLPSKGCTTGTPVTLRTVTATATMAALDVLGEKNIPLSITPSTIAAYEPLMATIRTTSTSVAALRTVADASHWVFIGLIFEASNAVTNASTNIVQLGDNTISSAASLPDNFTFERCAFRAVSGGTAQRGLQGNAKNLTVRSSYFANIRSTVGESQTFAAFNSPGPFTFQKNYIEAGSIGMLFGGAGSAISGNIQQNITVTQNYMTRPMAWQSDTGYSIKNIFELKNAKFVQISGNIFENNWLDGQSGFIIVFTVRAQNATSPWSTIQDVNFENNIVRNSGAGFNILGLDTQLDGTCAADPPCPSTRMERVTIHNNLLYNVDRQTYDSPGGSIPGGRCFQVDQGPIDLRITNNTCTGPAVGPTVWLDGEASAGFVYENNIGEKQRIATGFPFDVDGGIMGDALGEGNNAITTYTTSDRSVTGNVLAGSTSGTYSSYPGNLFPTIATLRTDYVNPGADNYRLVGGSAYAGKGADQDRVEAAIAGTLDALTPRIRLRLRTVE